MGFNKFTDMSDPALDPLRKSGKGKEKEARKATHGAAKEAGKNIGEGQKLLDDLKKVKQGYDKLNKAAGGAGPAGKIGQLRNGASNLKDKLNNATDINRLAKRGVGKLASAAADVAIDKLAQSTAAYTGGLSLVAAPIIKKHKKETLLIILAILIVLFLPTLFLIYLFFGGRAAYDQQQKQGQTNPLQVFVTCVPPDPNAGQTSVCTIVVTDTQTESDITLVASIYPNAQYVSSTPNGVYDKAGNTVTWDANKLKLPLDAPINLVYTLTVRAQKKIGVPIVAVATPGGASGNCGSFNKNATDFNGLMTGQGRCTNVLGDENQFVAQLLKIGGTRFSFNGREADLHAIYQKAVAQKVNPLILVTIWGVESSFGTVAGENFNCGNFHDTFANSLNCAVNTLNHWMNYYDQQPTKPVKLTAKCVYSDPFILAYEKYTPECVINDNNSNARKNFVTFYRTLMGL